MFLTSISKAEIRYKIHKTQYKRSLHIIKNIKGIYNCRKLVIYLQSELIPFKDQYYTLKKSHQKLRHIISENIIS